MTGTGAFSLAAPTEVTIDGRPAARAASLPGSQVLPWLYQGEITLPAGLTEVTIESAALRTIRITSYNVCYTKLLRRWRRPRLYTGAYAGL